MTIRISPESISLRSDPSVSYWTMVVNRSQKFPILERSSKVIKFCWSLGRLLRGNGVTHDLGRFTRSRLTLRIPAAHRIHAASVTRPELCELILPLEILPCRGRVVSTWNTRDPIVRGRPHLIMRASSHTCLLECLRRIA